MPVVNAVSNQGRQLDNKLLDPIFTDAKVRHKTISVANASTDSQGSTYWLCRLPSDCILRATTAFYLTNWGYADIRIGTKSNPAALYSATKASTNATTPIANTVTPVTAGNPATHGKRLWELLGLAADPGGAIDLYLHGSVAAPVSAGTALAELSYLIR